MTCLKKKYVFLFLTTVILLGAVSGLILYSVLRWKLNPLRIKTKLGTIKGLEAADGNYSMFLGVPYALVDRENPFGPSTPFPTFESEFYANDDSVICPQLEEFNQTISGNLNCLRLNIYVPHSASANNLLPVMAYIHGGRDELGFSGRYLYGPAFLMKQDIILVTINYRLGPYGFMCLDTPEVPGNQGLKDELHALKWINENIHAFGGDPQKVTLSGISSSGTHVAMHLMYTNEPLFQQVIFRSGFKTYPLIMSEPDPTVPLRLADDLGLKTNNTNAALKFLASKDPLAVILSTNRLNIHFKPCVEREFDNVHNFITRFMSNIVDIPSVKNITMLITEASNEVLYQYGPKDFDNANKDIFTQLLYSIFDFDEERLKIMEEQVRLFYIGDQPISNHIKQNIINFASDLIHHHPTLRNIRRFLDNDVKRLYHAGFSYFGGRNLIRRLYRVDDSYEGATHNDDIGYVFDVSFLKDKHSKNDQLIIDRYTEALGNFVKYGEPNPKPSKLLPLEWEPVTKDSFFYYNIDTDVTTEVEPWRNRMAFWDLFYKLNGKYERLTEEDWIPKTACNEQI